MSQRIPVWDVPTRHGAGVIMRLVVVTFRAGDSAIGMVAANDVVSPSEQRDDDD